MDLRLQSCKSALLLGMQLFLVMCMCVHVCMCHVCHDLTGRLLIFMPPIPIAIVVVIPFANVC